MKLKVEHTTVFEYDGPVYETATEVRLKPSEHPDWPQRCLDFTLDVSPPARIAHYSDFYGNTVHQFNVLHSLHKLEIKATTIVATGEGRIPADRNGDVLRQDFLAESRYVRFDAQVREMAARFAGAGHRPGAPHDGAGHQLGAAHDGAGHRPGAAHNGASEPERIAEAICRCINEEFTYEPGVTDVHSTTEEVMALRSGVCQDFAHAMIAMCRALSIPARYVSGYLYGGESTEGHDRASHAWCEVYCGPRMGWIGFDPTHDPLYVDERYIRIGTGRDYADVTLVRGTFKGNAKEKLAATVRVMALDSNPTALSP